MDPIKKAHLKLNFTTFGIRTGHLKKDQEASSE